MTDKHFPIDASIISAEALTARVLPKYRLANPTCSLLAHGVNDTYSVTTNSKHYFLRVYRCAWRNRKHIASEVDMLNYLRADKQPVSYPIKCKNGAYVSRINAPEGIRYAVLFSDATGTIPNFRKLAVCHQYGEIAGRMHESMDRCKKDVQRFDIDLKHLIDDSLDSISLILFNRSKDMDFLQKVGTELKSELCKLPTEKPFYGLCHGDHHGGNVHQDSDGRMTVFDFDCYGYGWRAYDVAVFRWSLGLRYGFNGSQRGKGTRRWNAFMNGYSKVRCLTHNELKATALFIPARHIWLMALHANLSRTVGSNILNPGAIGRHIDIVRQSFAAADKLAM